ncbi:CBASS cGAMP-activated phospholipase [Adhaeretor mobilis]|uniref:Patatin-like phospholipase n=1 Tax=Adhaeretor mobilis TaxID=1930276 RepID=A0A517N0U2_9BACT|nr:CBASS cGAMP-activated phospholipase [Adhaeretor mobilis]QDT00734.1 Patatin-like phospholipase [Adhaeretor mobilis]
MARFQILSLIGGGIRGAFITSYLKELEQKLGRPIAESFDLIAGTSTGGIIAAGLALGMSAEQMHDFYVRYGEQIFTPRPPYKAKRLMRFIFPVANWVFREKTGSGLDSAFRARYCPHALQTAFDEGFGDRTLKSVEFTRLIIPSVNLSRGEPHIFRSRHLPLGVRDSNLKVSDVVIAATAAPTYFPHRQIRDEAFVDGGVWAADPSMLAFSETMRIQQFCTREGMDPAYSTKEVHLLSIGTGRAQYSLEPPGADAGVLFWAPRVADLMSTSQVQGLHLPLKYLLGDRYRHVNFPMERQWGLAEVENIPALFAMGEKRAEETFDWVSDSFLQHHRDQFVPFDSDEDAIDLDEFGFD